MEGLLICPTCHHEHEDLPVMSLRRRAAQNRLRFAENALKEAGMAYAAADDHATPLILGARLRLAAKAMHHAHLQLVDVIVDESARTTRTK